MKRFLMVLVFVFVFLILTGCSGVTPPPPEEEIPLALIREYTGRDNVTRWADGIVSVCDTTDETKGIWDKINEIIDGPVFFELTEDTDALIGIGYLPEHLTIDTPFVAGGGIDNYKFKWFGININPKIVVPLSVYQQTCLMSIGIKEEKAAEGFSQEVQAVLYWLYRLEPGCPLM